MMNYKKHDEIPAIPADLASECLAHAEDLLSRNVAKYAWYQGYDTTNKNSMSYVKPGTETDESNGNESGGVGFYALPPVLSERLLKFCRDTKIPEINFDAFAIQIVGEGKFTGPHIDDPKLRKQGFLFMLNAGGPNVITTWYDIKPEYLNSEQTYNAYIPFSRLTIANSHCLEENVWHWLDFNKVHGVENQTSTRIAIWGFNYR